MFYKSTIKILVEIVDRLFHFFSIQLSCAYNFSIHYFQETFLSIDQSKKCQIEIDKLFMSTQDSGINVNAKINLYDSELCSQIKHTIKLSQEDPFICLHVHLVSNEKIILVVTTYQIICYIMKKSKSKYVDFEHYPLFDIKRISVDKDILCIYFNKKATHQVVSDKYCGEIASQIYNFLRSILHKDQLPQLCFPEYNNTHIQKNPYIRFMMKCIESKTKISSSNAEKLKFFYNSKPSTVVLSDFSYLKKVHLAIFISSLLLMPSVTDLIAEKVDQFTFNIICSLFQYSSSIRFLCLKDTKSEIDFSPLDNAISSNRSGCQLCELSFSNFLLTQQNLNILFRISHNYPMKSIIIDKPMEHVLDIFKSKFSDDHISARGIISFSVIQPTTSTNYQNLLSQLSCLKSLILCNIGHDINQIFKFINTAKIPIEYLDISENSGNTSIKATQIPPKLHYFRATKMKWSVESFLDAFIALIKHNSLISIDFSLSQLRNHHWQLIFQYLVAFCSQPDNYISFSDFPSLKTIPKPSKNPEILNNIKPISTKITTIKWVSNPLNPAFIAILKTGFPNLIDLDISGCLKQNDSLLPLIYNFLKQSKLEKLFIRGKKSRCLGQKNILDILNNINGLQTLKYFDFSNHKLGSQFVLPFSADLLKNSSLLLINIKGNRIYQESDYEMITNAINEREIPLKIIWPEGEFQTMQKNGSLKPEKLSF